MSNSETESRKRPPRSAYSKTMVDQKLIAKHTKARIYMDDESATKRDSLFGEPVQRDAAGRAYVDIPSHLEEQKQYVRDLYPHWELLPDFVDMDAVQAEQDRLSTSTTCPSTTRAGI
jgi:hypothetical protein